MILMRLLNPETWKKKKGRDSDVKQIMKKQGESSRKKGLTIMRKIRY